MVRQWRNDRRPEVNGIAFVWLHAIIANRLNQTANKTLPYSKTTPTGEIREQFRNG